MAVQRIVPQALYVSLRHETRLGGMVEAVMLLERCSEEDGTCQE
jgi:hypothetical protein